MAEFRAGLKVASLHIIAPNQKVIIGDNESLNHAYLLHTHVSAILPIQDIPYKSDTFVWHRQIRHIQENWANKIKAKNLYNSVQIFPAGFAK